MTESNPTLVFPAERIVELQDHERPDPGDDEIPIETDTTLVSTGTEITVLSGDYPSGSFWDEYGEYPFVTGYTNVGTVVEAGPDVDLAAETRVASWTPHAAYVTATADECIPIPDDVSDAEAAPFAVAQIVANGLRRGRVDWGETVVVYGLGILGQFAVRLAHLAGAEQVIGVDLSENRIAYLPNEPGITGVDVTDTDPAEAVADLTDGAMADVVVEVTGNPDAIPDEFDVLREQGRMVLLSSPHGETTLDFHDYVNAPSYEIIGAHQTSHPVHATRVDPWTKERHAELFFTYQRQGRLDVEPLYSHVRDCEDAPELYRELLKDRTRAMGVRLEW